MITKPGDGVEQARETGDKGAVTFSSATKWWVTLCHLVALPIHPNHCWQKSLQWVALFLNGMAGFVATFSLYLCLIYEQNNLSSRKAAAYSLSIEIGVYDISTFGVHALLFFSASRINKLASILDDTLKLDSDLYSKLKRLSIFLVMWVTFVVWARTILGIAIFYEKPINGCLFPTCFGFNIFCITLYAASFVYTMVIGYTFSIYAIALGWQLQSLTRNVQRSSINLNEAQKCYIELVQAVQHVQSAFGVLTLVTIASSSLIICMRTYMLTVPPGHDTFRNGTGGRVSPIMWMLEFSRFLDVLENFTRVAFMCITADNLTSAAHEAVQAVAISQAESHWPAAESARSLLQIQVLGTYLTASGFFAIGKPLLLTVISIVISYTVILSQFAARMSP